MRYEEDAFSSEWLRVYMCLVLFVVVSKILNSSESLSYLLEVGV